MPTEQHKVTTSPENELLSRIEALYAEYSFSFDTSHHLKSLIDSLKDDLQSE